MEEFLRCGSDGEQCQQRDLTRLHPWESVTPRIAAGGRVRNR
jgi:hypothetical protein